MFHPISFPQPGSYSDLKKRVAQSMRSAQVDDQVFETVKNLFETTLKSEQIVLSRPERDRLLRHVLQAVLTDMLTKLNRDLQ